MAMMRALQLLGDRDIAFGFGGRMSAWCSAGRAECEVPEAWASPKNGAGPPPTDE